MINEMINSPAAKTRGFVLDLNFTKEDSETPNWYSRIFEANMLNGDHFTHVVELLMSETEVKMRAEGMLATIHDGQVFSKWERAERNKPKPVLEDEEEAPEEDEENAPKPLIEKDMVRRACDQVDVLNEQI